jgi:DNA-binding NarL/FixJ family response regulator
MAQRVLIVDDSNDVRDLLQGIFASEPDFEVCGAAENGREAIQAAERCLPDLVILDLSMPVLNGLETAPLLIQALPGVTVVLFTVHSSPTLVRAATNAGIHAVISKTETSQLISNARELLKARSRKRAST